MSKKTVLLLVSLVAAAALAIVLWVCLPGSYTTLVIESTEGAKEPCDTVTLDVIMSDNSGFTDIELQLDFDRERLEFEGLCDTYTDMYGQTLPYLSNATYQMKQDEDGTVRVHISAEEEVSEDGGICGITFRILNEAEIGVADVTIADAVIRNGDKTVDTVCVEGGVLVGQISCTHNEMFPTYAQLDGRNHYKMQNCAICNRVVTKDKEYCIDRDTSGACDLCLRDIFVNVNITSSDISFGEDLTMHFIMEVIDEDVARECKAIIWKGYERKAEVEEIPFEQWERTEDGRYTVSSGVNFREMMLPIVVEVKDVRGNLTSNLFEITPGGTAYGILEDQTASDEKKTAMVDFLNFVTQVQLFFNYNLDNLANSKLTQEQLALATDTVVCVDRSLADARSSGLNMEVGARLALKFYFNGLDENSVATKYAMIRFTDHGGEEKQIRVASDEIFCFMKNEGIYAVVVDELAITDVSQVVTVTVYNADGSIYSECSDSIEGYLKRMEDRDMMVDFGRALMKLSVSAKALTN